MSLKAKGIRLSDDLDRKIAREADASGRSWSATTHELLTEAIRMRRAPGIVFVEGVTGRRAAVAGSGLDVWEVVAAWKAVGGDFPALREELHWLTEPQLRSALAYYELYPEEIDARLEREQEWTPEKLRRELPFAGPTP
jgi:uncharacterized protein (DUF433 family)